MRLLSGASMMDYITIRIEPRRQQNDAKDPTARAVLAIKRPDAMQPRQRAMCVRSMSDKRQRPTCARVVWRA